jgi:hypothetical protein
MRVCSDRLVVALALGIVGCADAEHSVPLETLVERTVVAMGGDSALGRIESVWRQRNERMFTLRKRPDLHLVVLLNGSGGIRYAEGFDGEQAWELENDGPKVQASERARIALWHTTQFPSVLYPLSRMEDLGHELELMPPDTVDGVVYHRVLLRLSDGFERSYYINPDTYRIERARDVRRFHAYEEEIQPIEGIWSDFRPIDGVWVPFTSGERNYETGERLSGGTLRQVRFNIPISDDVFSLGGDLGPFLQLISELTRG